MNKKILIGGLVVMAIIAVVAFVILRVPAEEYVPAEQPAERLLVKTPIIIGSVDTPDWAQDVFISGDHAFVADRWSGLQIIDISKDKEET